MTLSFASWYSIFSRNRPFRLYTDCSSSVCIFRLATLPCASRYRRRNRSRSCRNTWLPKWRAQLDGLVQKPVPGSHSITQHWNTHENIVDCKTNALFFFLVLLDIQNHLYDSRMMILCLCTENSFYFLWHLARPSRKACATLRCIFRSSVTIVHRVISSRIHFSKNCPWRWCTNWISWSWTSRLARKRSRIRFCDDLCTTVSSNTLEWLYKYRL